MQRPLSDLVDYCSDWSQYPKRLLSPGVAQPYTLRDLSQRLTLEASRLFCRPGSAKLVIVRYDSAQNTITDERLTTLFELQQHVPCAARFGQDYSLCHWAFIEAYSFRDVLDISRDMMLYLCSFFQIMPAFVEFMLPFGRKLHDYDFHFSAFRPDVRIDPKAGRGRFDEVNRSGQDFQLCYNLKSVEHKEGQDWPWSFRQAAVSHSFDVGSGCSNWIILKAQPNIRQRITEVLGTAVNRNQDVYRQKAANFAHSLDCHIVLADWCVENWRWYIKYFEERLDQATERAILDRITRGSPGTVVDSNQAPNMTSQPLFPRNRTWTGRLGRTLTGIRRNTTQGQIQAPTPLQPLTQPPATIVYEDPEELPPGMEKSQHDMTSVQSKDMFRIDDLQSAQYLETKANETVLVIRSNIGIITHLGQFYEDIGKSQHLAPALLRQVPGGLPPQATKAEIDNAICEFVRHLAELRSELENHRDRMQTIVKLATDRKNLLYSLVEYQNMEANTAFAKEAQISAGRMERMTQDMQNLTRKTALETVLMRVITLVTLLFLPATFVSTLMSAQIVFFHKEDDGIRSGNTSLGALKLFVCLTATLTMATLTGGYSLYAWERRYGSAGAGS